MAEQTSSGSSAARTALAGAFLVATALVASGFFHFIHGGQIGCAVLPKEEWGVHDTVVDFGELEQMSWLQVMGEGHVGVARALIRDGYIDPPITAEEAADLRRSADELRRLTEGR